MRNSIETKDILQNPTLKEWESSKVLLSKREMWLDKIVDKMGDNELQDNLIKLRKMDIHKDLNAYEETSEFVLSKFFKNMGATAHITKDAVMPNIQFSKSFVPKTGSKNPLGNNVSLATYDNSLLTYNNMIIGMYDQITPTNASPIMDEFPEAMYPAIGLYIASWSPIQGMTMPQQIGQPFFNQPKRTVNYQFFQTTSFAEKVVNHQEEVVGLRDPASNSYMDRGLPLYMAKNQAMIQHRKQTRDIFNIYRAIYDGEFWSDGAALSYNINPANRITGSQLAGAPWVTYDPTSDTITSLGDVNVLLALRNFAHAILRRYTGYGFNMYMNSMTLSAIISSLSITPVSNFGPGTQVGSGRSSGDEIQLETIINQFLGTSAKLKIIIDDSQYYPDAYDPLGRTASTTNSFYLNDIGKIFVAPQVQATGAGMGQYAYTPIVQNGGMYNPQPGAAYFMIDTFASNTVEGMENPSLNQALRYSAMPLIFRNNDLFTLDITK